MDKFFGATGYVRSDDFGRVVVDKCATDSEHLRSAETDVETNKATCRVLVEELFASLLGKRGNLTITVSFQEDETPDSVSGAVQKHLEDRGSS